MDIVGQIVINDIRFIWEIDHFSNQCKSVGESISSPIFSPGKAIDKCQTRWQLVLHPYGESADCENFLSVYLTATDDVIGEGRACFKLSLLNGIREECHTSVSSCRMFKKAEWGFPKFIKRDTLMNSKDDLLIQDKLIILCVICINPYSNYVLKQESELKNNFESILSDESHSDVTISIKGKTLCAHKNILTTRSKVFAGMLQYEMRESNTNNIVISDISYDVMKEVLRFIYSGKVADLAKIAKELLVAADKYDLWILKARCEEALWINVNIENACETLGIASLYNCSKLKSDTIDFILKNMKDIIGTNGFKELKLYNSNLLEEIICTIALENKLVLE